MKLIKIKVLFKTSFFFPDPSVLLAICCCVKTNRITEREDVLEGCGSLGFVNKITSSVQLEKEK